MPSSRSKQWCSALLNKTFSPAEIAAKFSDLEQFARASWPEDGMFSMEWLAAVMQRIDKLWYDGYLLPKIYATYGGLHLYVDSEHERVAGYVEETADKESLSLHMNRSLFASLFTKQERGYHSGGLLCEDRLVCMLHVILHESVHLALTLCDKLGHRADIRDHGKEFNRIVKNMFGQTDPQHGLIPGYEQFHDLHTIRKHIEEGSRVEVFSGGKWKPCIVEQKGKKWVVVKTADGHKLRIHAGLLRLPDRLDEK